MTDSQLKGLPPRAAAANTAAAFSLSACTSRTLLMLLQSDGPCGTPAAGQASTSIPMDIA